MCLTYVPSFHTTILYLIRPPLPPTKTPILLLFTFFIPSPIPLIPFPPLPTQPIYLQYIPSLVLSYHLYYGALRTFIQGKYSAVVKVTFSISSWINDQRTPKVHSYKHCIALRCGYVNYFLPQLNAIHHNFKLKIKKVIATLQSRQSLCCECNAATQRNASMDRPLFV